MLSHCLTLIKNHYISGSEGPGGRLDHEHLMSGLYNQVAAGQRPESASSASPPSNHPAHFPPFPTTSGGPGMLVVPQPINASKVQTCPLSVFSNSTSPLQMGVMGGEPGVGFSHHHVPGGARKYQCKMCPQVGISSL